MGRAKRNQKILAVAGLHEGEEVALVTIAEVGSLKPSNRSMATTAASVAIAGALGFGSTVTVQRKRFGLVLTDWRLVLVDLASATGGWRASGELPLEDIRRTEVTTRAYLWFDLVDRSSQPVMRLSFPLPNRADGRQLAEAIRPVEAVPA